MLALRHRGIAYALAALKCLHAERWLAPIARGEGIVFTLHRVCADDPEAFEPNRALQVTPEFLRLMIQETRRSGFDFISIDDVLDRMRSGYKSRRPFAALTFDDGYRDNIDVASPILRSEGVPWAMFVVPDFLDGRGRLWWQEIEDIVRHADQICCLFEGENFVADCRQAKTKNQVFKSLTRFCYRLSENRRLTFLNQLAKGHSSVDQNRGRTVCLTWQELVNAASDPNLTIGSHTTSHAILPNCSLQELKWQIVESKARIEAKIGRPVKHLAYPHGLVDKEAGLQQVKSAGYAAAWTTRGAHLTSGWLTNAPFLLPRVSMNGLHANRAMLHAVLSGVPYLARSAPAKMR